MTESNRQPPPELLEAMDNLSHFHREHEKFYSQAPLRQAQEIQATSRVFKALAARWAEVDPADHPAPSPFAGTEDLNPPGLVSESGVLFMEGEGEPAEIAHAKRELATMASDSEQTADWLSAAMEASWQVAGASARFPELADLLGERHMIITHDWQAADMNRLAAHCIRRALELLETVDFTPAALREDLAGARDNPSYLYSASELLDRAADLKATSATLVHANERRWRIFGERVKQLRSRAG